MDKKKKATELLGKTKDKVVKTLDQDNDNKLTGKDIVIVAETIEYTAKKTKNNIKESLDKKNLIKQKRELQPIFSNDLKDPTFKISKMVRITNIDKRRSSSPVCKNSIGYYSIFEDTKLVNIFNNKADLFGLSFFPDKTHDIYYVDPVYKNKYIAADLYFAYLKDVRVNELQMLAQDLGAKHFKVTYKGYKSSSLNKKFKGKVEIEDFGIEAEHNKDQNDVFEVDVAAEATFSPHEPIKPKIKYLKKELCIQTLITMRFNEKAPLTHQKYTMNLSNTSGISIKDAIKLDANIKDMKTSGNVSFTSIVNNEAKSVFEYEIDF